jgi:hypothetical protein
MPAKPGTVSLERPFRISLIDVENDDICRIDHRWDPSGIVTDLYEQGWADGEYLRK